MEAPFYQYYVEDMSVSALYKCRDGMSGQFDLVKCLIWHGNMKEVLIKGHI